MSGKKYLYLFIIQFILILLIKIFLIFTFVIKTNQKAFEEVNKIKTHIRSILDENATFISIVEKKISQDSPHIDKTNKIPFYLSLITLNENSVFNEGTYIFIGKDKKFISQLGVSTFTSLPIDALTLLTNINPQDIHYKVYDNSLITIKKLASPQSYKEPIYLIIQSNLLQISKKTTQQLAIQNPYLIKNNNLEQSISVGQEIYQPINGELALVYQSESILNIIKFQVLSWDWLLYTAFWMLTYASWVTMIFTSNKKRDAKELSLQKINNELLNYNHKLEVDIRDMKLSYTLIQDLYESLIQPSFTYTSLLNKRKANSKLRGINENTQTNITELMLECCNILSPLLHNTGIKLHKALEFLIYAICDALVLKILIINLLHQAILRTPQKGSITLKSYILDHVLYIKIKDTGYNINQFTKLTKPPTSIYNLPQNLLADIATLLNIKVKISYKSGTNITLQINPHPIPQSNPIQEGISNVITFPAKD